ncbi:RICIN domain-containing protein [Umezawaea sp. NPDC059074]|uniref:RICIN domain-containing protein n=1 Tax=Umezawaea sp. NPDC059074 TaxID=3346716 RepID=UPI003673FE69
MRSRRAALPLACAALLVCVVVGAPAQADPVPVAPDAPVELVELGTETTRVFQNPSGTRTVEEFVRPFRAKTAAGWAPVDTTLVRGSDGAVRPKVTPVPVRFSGGGDDALASVRRDGRELSLSWPRTLPEPDLDGDTATYREVLPGVDLRVRADLDGFSQVLVVHDAAAAANPDLREITYGTAGHGVRIVAGENGATTAVDDAGNAVFVSGSPVMWDTPASPAGLVAATAVPEVDHRPIGLEVRDGELAVLPDAAMLTSPTTSFPLYIDPSYSATQYRWTSVNSYSPTTSYWTSQRDTSRVGYQSYSSPTSRYRSFFQVNTAPFAGGRVLDTWFAVTLDHSGGCASTPVDFWHTRAIDPANAVTWNNTTSHWLTKLDTRSGHANEAGGCGTTQPDMPMEFSSTALKTLVQTTATNGTGTLTFGFRAPNESDNNQWKKFLPATARLVVEYNIAPRPPLNFTTVPPTPCGTATAPTALNTATPTFSAIASDPDNDNVRGQLEILDGDVVVKTVDGPTIASGGAFAWSPLPTGVLPEDQPTKVFNYRSRIRDAGLPSTDSARCYFTVDRTRPGLPTVASADFPDGTPVRAVGELGTVTFTRATGDADVAGFRYGFQQDKTTMWVAADAAGSATVPITLWDDASGGTKSLFVRAVDRAGNISPSGPVWTLTATLRAVPGTAVRADTNGDRRADFATLFDQGDGRTAAWNFLSTGGGFSSGYVGWDTDVSGGFPLYRVKSANGDFDGDGRSDIAVLREDPDRKVRLFLLRSDGNRFDAEGEPAWSGDYRLSHLRLAAGDFDGDGDDDLAVFQGLTGAQTRLWVHLASGGGFAAPVLQWDSGANGLDVNQLSPVAGDFDGDGDDDLAAFRGVAGATATKLWLHVSNRTSFAAPVQQWDSGTTTFDRARATFAATNVTGDAAGRDEIVAEYDRGNASTQVVVFTAGTGTWATSVGWDSGAANTFDARKTVLAAGDFNGDGKGDIATLYDTGGGNRQLHTFLSTGTAFAAKRTDWTGRVADVADSVYVEPGRRYRLQPTHTDKCAGVPAGNVANGGLAQQQACVAGAGNQQFELLRIGATPYYRFKVASSGKCLDIGGYKREDNAAVAQYTCDPSGVPQANQQFRLDYVGGSGMDVVVQPRIVHSDKCLTVTGAGTGDNIAVVQVTCSGLANQRYALRIEP